MSTNPFQPAGVLGFCDHVATDKMQISFSVNNELYATGEFEKLDQADDEKEHSIELHLPYIAKVMER